MKTFRITYFFLLCIAGAYLPPLHAQESCYEQYLREHNKKILTAEDADDSYDELKKTVLARQMYGDSYLLMVDTIAQRAMITKVDGTYVADVHVALVDSTWYMWLSVDPLADQNIQNTPYMYCSGNPIIRIDPDGRFDKEEIWDGLKHMGQGGVDGIIAFAAWVAIPETAGTSALVAVPMTIEGYSEFQIGFGRCLDGFFSDPQEGKMERLQQLPTSLFNTIAKGIDQSMGNKNKEAETIVDGLKIISGSRLRLRDAPNVIQDISRIKTIMDVNKWIKNTMEQYGVSLDESNSPIDNNPTLKETNVEQIIK